MELVRLSSSMGGAEETLRQWISGEAATVFAHDDVVAQLGILRDQLLSGRPGWSPGVRNLRGTSTQIVPLVGWTWGKMPPVDAASGRLTVERQNAADALGYAMRTIRSSRRLVSSSQVGSARSYPLEAAVVGEPQQALLSPSSLADTARVDLYPGVARSSLEAYQYARRVLDALREGRSSMSPAPSSVFWMSREYSTSSRYAEIVAYAAITAGSLAGLYLLGAFRSDKIDGGRIEDDQEADPRSSRSQPSQRSKRSSMPLPKNPYGDPISRVSFTPFS
jgi:hypothetical protein